MRPPLPRLHAITDERVARRPDLDSIAQSLAAGGGATFAFHARGRTLSGLEHFRLATRLSVYPSARLFVNDRLDVALGVGASGVQLGVGSLSPRDARRLAGSREWWIGSSVHDVAEARAARAAGAEYLVAGPVYHTASHPEVGDTRQPLGPERLREIIAIGLPVIAIGGISSERVREVCGAGAYGVAAIRALWDVSDPAGAARSMAGACSA